MDFTLQKIALTLMATAILAVSLPAGAATLKKCNTAPLIVTTKNVGQVSYFAENCEKAWDTQSIQLDFAYSYDIPEWAFKRAATHFLKKNVAGYSPNMALNQITQWYKPVKKGDLYRLNYQHTAQKMTLLLNQKLLGQVSDPQINQYFNIWFGVTPFNVKLKQQLLN